VPARDMRLDRIVAGSGSFYKTVIANVLPG
jgi:hypothetical protein